MKSNAIYPGTFDPITYGHIDVIKKALKFVNTLINYIEQLNKDNTVHGILVQLPLPEHINKDSVLNSVSKFKDVDGFASADFFDDEDKNSKAE